MTPAPFVIRMLVLDGDPDGIRMLDRSNWTGKAVVFPRSLIQKVRSLPEYQKPGVYLLCGAPDEDGITKLYIGEGDPVACRIDQHHAKKDFWTWGVFFTSSDATLNKVHIQYLEAELVRLAQEAKRTTLDNANTPQKPSLSAADEAEAVGFLANMLGILPLVGIHAFEKAAEKPEASNLLHLSVGKLHGTGFETSDGFVVCKGAAINPVVADSLSPSFRQKRQAFIDSEAVVKEGAGLFLKEERTFSSPSAAAVFLLGYNCNGREVWKDSQKRSMNELAALATATEQVIP